MTLRAPLRLKIMVLTVIPLMTLAFAALWTVNRSVTRQVDSSVHEDLRRASMVLENILASRARSIAVAGQVIVQDPRFFSVLTLPAPSRDPELRATVNGVAADFNAITQSDLFDVYSRDGVRLASAGRDPDREETMPNPLVPMALSGHPVSGLLAGHEAHYQVSVTPVIAGGRVVGALVLGSRIGRRLAEQLRDLTRSDVSFASGAVLTGSTLEQAEDRDALLTALGDAAEVTSPRRLGTIFRLQGQGHVYLTLAQSIPQAGETGRQLYVMQRALDVETAYLRDLQNVLVQFGIAAALAALLAGALISDRITSPVRRIVRAAEEMERGNYDFPLEVTIGDEIGSLAASFENMREHQRAYVSTLEEVARLKSEFISIASHELRTPITIIRGFQELMTEAALGPITPQQKQALEGMDRSLTTLTRIAEDATRMSLIESERLTLTLSDCSINGIVEDAVRIATSSAAGRGVSVAFRPAGGLPTYRLDAPRLTLAIANLVRNGIRFTPDGGHVEVRVSEQQGALMVEVVDSGIGMSEARRARLFDRALQVGESAHHHSSGTLEFNSAGLGLGLSIARGIVQAHGGTLEVDSEVGRGTTVTIRLPVRRAAQKEAA